MRQGLQAYIEESNKLIRLYNSIIAIQPTTFMGNRDSHPNAIEATHYYEKLFQLTQQLEAITKIELTTEEVEKTSRIYEKISFIKNFINEEFILTAEDIHKVALKKRKLITYHNNDQLFTRELNIYEINATIGTFDLSELAKHFDNIRYIYDRLLFLNAVLKSGQFNQHLESHQGKQVEDLRNILEKQFTYVLANPPMIQSGPCFWQSKANNPYGAIVTKRVNEGTSPIQISLSFSIKIPDEVILMHIFKYLNPIELMTVSLVCKQFYRIANDSYLWKQWHNMTQFIRHQLTAPTRGTKSIKHAISKTRPSFDDQLKLSKHPLNLDPTTFYPDPHPSFEASGENFLAQKRAVVKSYTETKKQVEDSFNGHGPLMLFERPKDPVVIIKRILNTIYSTEDFKTNDLIFAVHEFCDLLIRHKQGKLDDLQTFEHGSHQRTIGETLVQIATGITSERIAKHFVPPYEVYEFIKQKQVPSQCFELSYRFPWLIQPIPQAGFTK